MGGKVRGLGGREGGQTATRPPCEGYNRVSVSMPVSERCAFIFYNSEVSGLWYCIALYVYIVFPLGGS